MSNKLPGTMGNPSINKSGQFGSKPILDVSDLKKIGKLLDAGQDVIDNKVSDIEPENTIKDVPENLSTGTTNISDDIEEEFECGVCHKIFKQNIGLQGHRRGPCGKNKPKEVEGNKQ